MSEISEIKGAAGEYKKWALEARKQYIELRLKQDKEIRHLYNRAADRLAYKIRHIKTDTFSGKIKKKQMEALEKELKAEAERISNELEGYMRDYIEQAVEAGAGYSRNVVIDAFTKAGISTSRIRNTFAAVNKQATEACWARTKKGLYLSDRIWQQGERYRSTVTNIIQESVAIGQDAATTARILERYIKEGSNTLAVNYPNMMKRMAGRIPKDISYEALRLARTEMTAAFGEGTIAAASVSPSYKGMKLVLSNSHPIADICDNLAAYDVGLGRGIYPPGDEPMIPIHPNCLCTLVPIHEEPEEFVEKLKAWRDNPESQPKLEEWYTETYRGKKQEPLAEKIADVEKNLVKRDTEKAVLFDTNGIVFEKEGEQSYVGFTEEEMVLMKDKILTHNHPKGTSLSFDDVKLAVKCDMKEMRACGKEYVYYVRRPENGWNVIEWPEIENLAEQYNKETRREFWDLIDRGKLTPQEASFSHWHKVWTKVAKEVGLDYGREHR